MVDTEQGVGWRTALLRIGTAGAVIAAIVGSGLAIYHNQRPRSGMPVAVFRAAPAPRETAAPTVEDAITHLQNEVAQTPDNADAWRTLGWSYFQRAQYTQSADALRQSARLDPTSARTLSFLGEALLQAHHPEGHMPREARLAFDEAIKLDPKDARARYYRAVGWDLAGQHRRAINAWFSLLKDTPADAPYAGDIRAVIRTVAQRHHIKVEKRLAEAQFAAPANGALPASVPGPAKVSVPEPAGDRMRAVENVPRPGSSGREPAAAASSH
ncbi:tetratricopeptide repeat protein [Novosphingobium sp.]|uniref:tetratricopeptide repeat protein n=1 Tax=Novosphingobium sp. TaxID=1874826 RepID=UPI003B51E9A3